MGGYHEMRFLGIDQSLTHTGVCLLDDEEVTLLDTIVPPRGLHGVKRLLHIEEEVRQLLVLEPALVAFEGYAYEKTMKAHDLGEIGGVLRTLAARMDVAFIEVAPTALKKFATSDAMATKDAMMREAPSAKDDHQADAFHLAHVARLFAGCGSTAKRAQLEVLRTLQRGKKKVKKRRVRKLIAGAL